MTQENKLELINYLVEELSNECEKQGVTHVVAINVDKNHVLNGGGGNAGEMIECVTSLEQVIEQQVGMSYDFLREIVMSEDSCDCPRCRDHQEELTSSTDDLIADFLDTLFKTATQGGRSK